MQRIAPTRMAAIKSRLQGYTAGDTGPGVGPHHLLARVAGSGDRTAAA